MLPRDPAAVNGGRRARVIADAGAKTRVGKAAFAWKMDFSER